MALYRGPLTLEGAPETGDTTQVVDSRFGTGAVPTQPSGWGGGGGTITGGYRSILDYGGTGNGVDDNTAAFNAAIADIAPLGGVLFFPAGLYVISGTTVPVPMGVTLLGEGYDWNAPWGGWAPMSSGGGIPPSKGSIIKATGSMPRLIQLGVSGSNNDPASGPGASLQSLSVWGNNVAHAAIQTKGRRNYIKDCQAYEGSQNTILVDGQNTHIIGGVVGAGGRGNGVLISGVDAKVWDAQVRESGSGGALVNIRGNNAKVNRCHLYHGQSSLAAINVDGFSNGHWGAMIVGNTIEEVGGPEIRLRLPDTPGQDPVRGVTITGNYGYTRTDGAPFVDVVGVGKLHSTTVTGNTVCGQSASTPYSAIVRFPANALEECKAVVLSGNAGDNCEAITTGTVPAGVLSATNAVVDSTGTVHSD